MEKFHIYNDKVKGITTSNEVYTNWPITFLMYVEDSRNPFRLGKKSYRDSWTAVARQLLETVELPAYSVCGCPPSSSTPIRLQTKDWAHFPTHNPTTEKKKPSKRCCVLPTRKRM
jgi:hypothetical protein